MRNDFYLRIALLRNLYNVAKVANASIDLDFVVEELFEGGDVEDLVARGLGKVDDVLGRGIVSNHRLGHITKAIPS